MRDVALGVLGILLGGLGLFISFSAFSYSIAVYRRPGRHLSPASLSDSIFRHAPFALVVLSLDTFQSLKRPL